MASIIFFSPPEADRALVAASATGVRSISLLERVVMEFVLFSILSGAGFK
jgi:hypothetical protein